MKNGNGNEVEAKALGEVRYQPPVDLDGMVTVRLTIPRAKAEKLDAFMASDTWEQAQAVREARLEQCPASVAALLNTARRHLGTSGGRVCATLLASLYNGNRVKFDASDLRRLDAELFEHAMNAMRLCYELNAEPHSFFDKGGALFEEMIETWGLEKKRRARK